MRGNKEESKFQFKKKLRACLKTLIEIVSITPKTSTGDLQVFSRGVKKQKRKGFPGSLSDPTVSSGNLFHLCASTN